jgi:hypothetical protein
MFKIQIDTRQPNPVPMNQCNLWQISDDLWCIEVISSSDQIEIMGHLDGAVVFNPYGGESSAIITVETENSKFYGARFWQSIDQHHENSHKYFLIKWFCRDSDWSDAAETAAMDRGSRWIYDQRWQTETPVATRVTGC